MSIEYLVHALLSKLMVLIGCVSLYEGMCVFMSVNGEFEARTKHSCFFPHLNRCPDGSVALALRP